MTVPSHLKKGDEIIIIATARKVSNKELEPAIELLQTNGFIVILSKHLYSIENQFAGSDLERLEDLQWALNHKTAKAIINARGGYGTVKLIEHIDFTEFIKYPKWFVGYSDITVLHNAFNNIGISSLHATMAFSFNKNEQATQSLIDALVGNYSVIKNETHILNKKGKTTAEIVGGNLSLIYSLSGTPFNIDTKNKILFIEDLDEYLYHIDRMMMQLKLSGKLKHLAGLVVGGMSDMKDNTIPFGKTTENIILEAVKEYNYPVCFNFSAGHIDKNLALYLGKKTVLEVTAAEVTISYI